MKIVNVLDILVIFIIFVLMWSVTTGTIFFYLYSRGSWERERIVSDTLMTVFEHTLMINCSNSQREILKSSVYQFSILKVFSLYHTHTHFGSERNHADDVRRWPNVLRQNRKQERGENVLHSQRFPLPSNVPHFLSHNSQPPTSTNPLRTQALTQQAYFHDK